MRNTYLQSLEKLSELDKQIINQVYKAALEASQQIFLEAFLQGGEIKFDILEGEVEYDINTGTGKFIPSKTFKQLLNKSEESCTSNLLSKKLSRFVILLQEAYRDRSDIGLQDPYTVWQRAGNNGTKKDFINWINKMSEKHE